MARPRRELKVLGQLEPQEEVEPVVIISQVDELNHMPVEFFRQRILSETSELTDLLFNGNAPDTLDLKYPVIIKELPELPEEIIIEEEEIIIPKKLKKRKLVERKKNELEVFISDLPERVREAAKKRVKSTTIYSFKAKRLLFKITNEKFHLKMGVNALRVKTIKRAREVAELVKGDQIISEKLKEEKLMQLIIRTVNQKKVAVHHAGYDDGVYKDSKL